MKFPKNISGTTARYNLDSIKGGKKGKGETKKFLTSRAHGKLRRNWNNSIGANLTYPPQKTIITE